MVDKETPAVDPRLQFLAAVKAVQEELRNPERNATVRVRTASGGSYEFSYTTQDALLDALRPLLSKHGLVLRFQLSTSPSASGSEQLMTLVLSHEAGYEESSSVLIPPAHLISGRDRPSRIEMQGMGSAMSYCRRYLISTYFPWAAQEDDDANVADGNVVDKLANLKKKLNGLNRDEKEGRDDA